MERDNEYIEENRKILKWLEKIKLEMIKKKYTIKEQAWIRFQLNMFYQERSNYKKQQKEIEYCFEKWMENGYFHRIFFLDEKIDKIIKRICKYKESIDSYIEEKSIYKEVSELSKSMIDSIDLKK